MCGRAAHHSRLRPEFCTTVCGLTGSVALSLSALAGPRMKFEASRDRARVNAEVRTWRLRKPSTRRPWWEGIAAMAWHCSTPMHRCKCGQTFETEFGNARKLSYRACVKPSTRVGPKPRRLSMLDLPSPMGLWPVQSRCCKTKGVAQTTGHHWNRRQSPIRRLRVWDRLMLDSRLFYRVSPISYAVAQARWRRETHRASVFAVATPMLSVLGHAARARFWDSAVRGCSALQSAIRRRLLQEVGVILYESTASVYWDLQKFYDSIDVRHLLRLEAECCFPMTVAVVDLQVHLGRRALRWAATSTWTMWLNVRWVARRPRSSKWWKQPKSSRTPAADWAWSSRPSRPFVAPTWRSKRCSREGCWSLEQILVSRGGPAILVSIRVEVQDVLLEWSACARLRDGARDSLLPVVTPRKLPVSTALKSGRAPALKLRAWILRHPPCKASVRALRTPCVPSLVDASRPVVPLVCATMRTLLWRQGASVFCKVCFRAKFWWRTRVRRAWRLSLEQLREFPMESSWLHERSCVSSLMLASWLETGWWRGCVLVFYGCGWLGRTDSALVAWHPVGALGLCGNPLGMIMQRVTTLPMSSEPMPTLKMAIGSQLISRIAHWKVWPVHSLSRSMVTYSLFPFKPCSPVATCVTQSDQLSGPLWIRYHVFWYSHDHVWSVNCNVSPFPVGLGTCPWWFPENLMFCYL